MIYLKTHQQGQPATGAEKYVGAVAETYDAKRENEPKWLIEQEIVESMLSDLPPGSWVCDAPIGTGRFIPFYEKQGLIVRGIDRSVDMIKQAAAKIKNPTALMNGVGQFMFQQGDVADTKMDDNSVDAAVNIRITRWLEPDHCRAMFKEMQRISRDRIILTARVANHKFARPLSLFESVMSSQWEIARNEQGVDEFYRIILFKKVAND